MPIPMWQPMFYSIRSKRFGILCSFPVFA
ncbi:hypothetical protein BC2230_190019 [Burkholderia cepacia]